MTNHWDRSKRTGRDHVSRERARRVICPYCGADRGAKCLRKNGGPREGCHDARHKVVLRVKVAG
jgi:hypothetical protein